ncbi:MAG: hypothetical protein HZC14_01315 [Candidatus Niyogibacteria bacterium]|nr:hypothetical protein [Candidatus Niyogibacteria bacterium]
MIKKFENFETREYLDAGIAVAVEGEAARAALSMAEEIAKRAPTVFRIDAKHLPHITLFQGRFPARSQEALNEYFQKITREQGVPLRIEMEDSLFARPNGNIFWNVKKTPEIIGLHKEMNDILRPLTDGMLMRQFSDLLKGASLSEEDRHQIEKYGALLAGDKYMPHITLCRLERAKDVDSIKNIKPPSVIFSAEKFIGGELGYYGTIDKVIFEEK